MGFRLVLNSVTLNDLERHNGPYSLRYFTEFGSFHGALRKVVEDIPTLSTAEMLRKESSFQRYILYGDIR